VLSVSVTLVGTLSLCIFLFLATRVPAEKALAFMAHPQVKSLKSYGVFALAFSIPLLLVALGLTALVLTSGRDGEGGASISILGVLTGIIMIITILVVIYLGWINYRVESFLELNKRGTAANLSLTAVAGIVDERQKAKSEAKANNRQKANRRWSALLGGFGGGGGGGQQKSRSRLSIGSPFNFMKAPTGKCRLAAIVKEAKKLPTEPEPVPQNTGDKPRRLLGITLWRDNWNTPA